jgi:hypothetical protein
LTGLLDAYTIRARVTVTYAVFSPVAVFVFAFALGSSDWWKKLGGIVVACGGPLLAAQWGRSGGRKKQEWLWNEWGGPPTRKLLQFSGSDAHDTVGRRHELISAATGIAMPTVEEEARDLDAANAAYDDAIARLRELTRDKNEFALVFEENANYGLRRNLWGRKPYGLGVALITAAAAGTLLALDYTQHRWNSPAAAGVSALFAVIALFVWLVVVTPAWVRETADAYAIRLVESAARVPPRKQ